MPTYEFRCPDGTIVEKMFKADEKHLRKLAAQREAMALLDQSKHAPHAPSGDH